MRHVTLPHHLYVWCDNKYLGVEAAGTTAAVLHGLCARPGQAILTHLILETGAHWTGVPIQGIYSKEEVPAPVHLRHIQAWGAMGEQINVCHFPYLEGLQVEVFRKEWHGRSTGIIVDWDDGFTRHPDQHKCLHLLEMETGHYTLQPNNYLRWSDPSFVDENKWEHAKKYRRGDKVWWPEDR
jgi:hypothetical protein